MRQRASAAVAMDHDCDRAAYLKIPLLEPRRAEFAWSAMWVFQHGVSTGRGNCILSFIVNFHPLIGQQVNRNAQVHCIGTGRRNFNLLQAAVMCYNAVQRLEAPFA